MRLSARGIGSKAAIALVAAGLLALATPAYATTQGPQTTDVSCDGTTIKTGVTVTHLRTGNFSIKQVNTNPTSSTKTWAVSARGNSLPTKTVSNNGAVIWTEVLPSSYTVKALRSAASNCNGILPGHGNYKWTYSVSYLG